MKSYDKLSGFFYQMYKWDKSTLSFLFEGCVPKQVMLSTYRIFVEVDGLIPIELLDVEEKVKLANECREVPISFNNKKLKDAAKILHTLKFIDANS